MTDPTWIFVIGAPRSGTSLLRRLLSSHPDLFISPELRILELHLIAGALAEHGTFTNTTSLSGRGIQHGRRFVERLAHHQRRHHGSRRYGDKYPPYSLQLPRLEALFPGAQYIHIIRDGRDVVRSLARTRAANRGWRRGPTIPGTDSLVRDWAAFVSTARQAGLPLGADRYHELRYEHLLADPAPVLRRAFGFLGLPSPPSLQDATAEIRTGRSWRETLSPAELMAFHRHPSAEALLSILGYAPTPLPEDRPQPSDPLLARIAQGEDSPSLWSAAAAAAPDGREARRHAVRAIRGPAPDRAACLRLLGEPEAPESVFAALNALSSPPDRQLQAALSRWAEGRGLDPAASAALFGPSEAA